MNRLRAWFEQGRIILPFGDEPTRRVIRLFLEELESHAWKNGDIVDLGKHNDMVMAFAHAIDQFIMPAKQGSFSVGATTLDNWQNSSNSTKPGGKYPFFF